MIYTLGRSGVFKVLTLRWQQFNSLLETKQLSKVSQNKKQRKIYDPLQLCKEETSFTQSLDKSKEEVTSVK